MSLKNKSDTEILWELQDLAGREKEALLQTLAYLREVQDRELHLARGYPSLFAFCVKFLAFSEAETIMRLRAMRLIREIPEVGNKIAEGKLSLTTAAKAQAAFRLASPTTEQKRTILVALEGKSTREAEKKLAEFFPGQAPPEKIKPIDGSLTRIEFNASRELMEKLDRLKQLLAHKNFQGRYDLLFEYLADEALKKFSPVVNAPAPSAPKATKKSRYIPSAIRKAVWTKFANGCQFRDPISGRRCGSQYGLEIDHIRPFASGGTHELGNLQLLCGAHNRFKSREATKFFRKTNLYES